MGEARRGFSFLLSHSPRSVTVWWAIIIFGQKSRSSMDTIRGVPEH